MPKKIVVTLVTFLLLVSIYNVDAQKHEFGIGVGAVSMTGDIVPTYSILANRPSALFYYKRNYKNDAAYRVMASVNQIYGSDAEYGTDVFSKSRDMSINTILIDLSLMYEYNFLDFRNIKKRVILSPYFLGGVGVSILSPPENKTGDYSIFQPIFPFGAGIKYRLKRKWILSVELIVKSMITDYLDNVSGDTQKVKNYNTGGKFNNDTYYFIGFKVGRSLWEKNCPFDAY